MKTIEQKAKAYDEIIKRAKIMLSAGEAMYGKENNASQLITDLIPELVESEDEKIRKWIKSFIEVRLPDAGEFEPQYQDALAYLERQKEQKPYCPSNDELEKAAKEFREKNVPPIEPISDELIDIIKDEFEGFRTLLKKKGIDYEPQRGYWEGFARLFDSSAREYVKEQKPVWSEEDEKLIRLIISILEDKHPNVFWRSNEMKSGVYTEELVDFLKSFPPFHKLSEEQIYTLERICSNLHLRASDDAPKLDKIIELLKRK